MIDNYGDEETAYAQAEYFIKIQHDYSWYNSDEANALTRYLIDGYPAKNVIFSFIVAQTFEMDLSGIIIKEMPSMEDVDKIMQSVLHLDAPSDFVTENAENAALLVPGEITPPDTAPNEDPAAVSGSALTFRDIYTASGSALEAEKIENTKTIDSSKTIESSETTDGLFDETIITSGSSLQIDDMPAFDAAIKTADVFKDLIQGYERKKFFLKTSISREV
jgi:hypothetical protein